MKNKLKKILELGSSIKTPYKDQIDEWFSEISISKISVGIDTPYYIISPFGEKFFNVDDAITKYMSYAYSPKNYGYIQYRLMERGIDFEDDYDLENPSEELIKMFEEEGKLVEEEYQILINEL